MATLLLDIALACADTRQQPLLGSLQVAPNLHTHWRIAKGGNNPLHLPRVTHQMLADAHSRPARTDVD